MSEVSLTSLMQTSPLSLIKQDDNPMMAQLFAQMGQKMPESKPSVELNINHAIFQKLKNVKDDTKMAKVANLLFDSALIVEGQSLQSTKDFSTQLNDVLLEWL